MAKLYLGSFQNSCTLSILHANQKWIEETMIFFLKLFKIGGFSFKEKNIKNQLMSKEVIFLIIGQEFLHIFLR